MWNRQKPLSTINYFFPLLLNEGPRDRLKEERQQLFQNHVGPLLGPDHSGY